MSREKRVSGIRRVLNLPESRRRVQHDVDDEIRFHLESRVAELVARGTPPEVARAIASREFGDIAEARSEIARVDRRRLTRERRQAWWETLGQDLSYSARSLRSQPGFAAVVILVLALGIGANVTMFGVIDRLLLRAPAHVTDPQRVVSIATGRRADGGARLQQYLSYPIYRDMRAASQAFDEVAAYSADDMAFGRGREAQGLRGMRVSANYFATLGVRPAVGRFFLPEEDGNPIAPRVVVLGYGFWQRQFEGSQSAIGRTLAVGDDQYTIVGVAPKAFTGVTNEAVDAWLPLTANVNAEEYASWLRSRQAYWLHLVARVRDDLTPEQAAAIATAALRAGAVRDGESPQDVETSGPSAHLASVLPREARANSTEAKVAVLLGAVSLLVLLITCANVANLQLARGIARQREVAVRIALGIDRSRLVRQLVCETVLLALAAGAAATVVTIWGGGFARRVLVTSDLATTTVDLRLVAYTALAAVLAGIVSGLLPALQASRPAVSDALRAGARAGGPVRSRTRSFLLVTQAALTVVFLVGAVLFVRSLRRVQSLPLGLEPDRVLVVKLRTSGMRIGESAVDALYARLLDAARSVPGVESAAIAGGLPFSTLWAEEVKVPGRDSVPLTRDGGPYFNAVSSDYFRTMGIRVLHGRGFTEADRGSSSRTVVVNKTLADLWWPNEDAIGHCMKVGGDTMPCAEVVGVVENTRRFQLIENPAVHFYVPRDQAPRWTHTGVLVVRPVGDAAHAVESLRRELQTRVPDAPFIDVSRLAELVNPQMRAWRLGATAFGVFGLLAVVVAALGLYSVLAYDVSRRFRELGIRVALGAETGDIRRMVVGRAVRVAVIGALIGFAIAIAAGPTVAPLLFQTSSRDPSAFLAAAAVMFTVAVLAALVPMRRAARVDPIIALRAD